MANMRKWVRTCYESLRQSISRAVAGGFLRMYRAQYVTADLWRRYGSRVTLIALAGALVGSWFLMTQHRAGVEDYFEEGQRLSNLRAVLYTLGGALLGAVAIVSSLVLFSMQVNVERMPHGLFRRLSADGRLLGAFAASFLLALGIAASAIVAEKGHIAVVLLVAGWSTVLILVSFFYAYRRALLLVNPLQQLAIVRADAVSELLAWARRAERARPLLQTAETTSATRAEVPHDVERLMFFGHNSYWTANAQRALRHAMSFAKRYAGQGDHEVSVAALAVVVAINVAYIQAKGKTFFASNALVENPLTTDGFINDTLEALRQELRAAVTSGDEQHIEQVLKTMAALVALYLRIDYANEFASKTHGLIAAGYLADGVSSVIPHDMGDVLMEGARLIGESAQRFVGEGHATEVATLSEKLAVLGCVGVAKDSYRPATMVCMEQLAALTFALLRTKKHDIHFAINEVKGDISFLAKLFLDVPDAPLMRTHSTYLGPYYSGTSSQAFLSRLTDLGNAIAEATADDKDAQTLCRNLEQWAERLYQSEKELLLAAIKARTMFAQEIVHWITHVTKVLLAVSNAPACPDHAREELRRHAQWLISVLTFIPRDKETVSFVENFRMTERIFEAGMDARTRDSLEIFASMSRFLLDWTFDAGRHQIGWAIFERALSGAAVMAMSEGEAAIAALKNGVSERLTKADAPDHEVRKRVASALREKAEEVPRREHWTSCIERGIAQRDPRAMRGLLRDLAQLFDPGDDKPPRP